MSDLGRKFTRIISRRLDRIAVLLAVLVLGSASGCCSLIGLAIGASSHTTRTVTPDEVRQGDFIIVDLANGHDAKGSYDGVSDDTLHMHGYEDTRIRIPLATVTSISVRTGSHWRTGLGVGLVVDAVTVGILGAVVAYGLGHRSDGQ